MSGNSITYAAAERLLARLQHGERLLPADAENVTASRKASGGLLLSSSGFSSTIFRGQVEFGPPVRLGGREKMISLFRLYYRMGSPLWMEDTDLHATLFAGTAGLDLQP